jgi:hypothetical protein
MAVQLAVQVAVKPAAQPAAGLCRSREEFVEKYCAKRKSRVANREKRIIEERLLR